MTEGKSSSQRFYSLIILAILIGVGILFIGGGPGAAQPALQEKETRLPEVKNETESFELLGAEIEVEDIKERGVKYEVLILRMRNNSKKAITAYSYSTNDGSYRESDFILGDSPIAPEAIYNLRINMQSIEIPGKATSDHPTVTILAVVFDDRTAEGDFNAVDAIFNDRLGQKIQLERINALLDETLNSPERDSPAVCDILRARIEALPTKREGKQPRAVEEGLSYIKMRVDYLIKHIKEFHESGGKILPQIEIYGSVSVQDALRKLKEANKKYIAML
jgi:hypothetical protein